MGIPIMLDVKDKMVLIVGGGNIGYRKACTFVQEHANVTCVSPSFNEKFYSLSEVKKVAGKYNKTFLKGMDVVIAATDDSELNRSIYNHCKEERILSMTVDYESPSDFSFMAYRNKQELTVALSTRGKSPKFAKEMINRIIDLIGEQHLDTLKDYIDEREQRLKKYYSPESKND